MQVSDLVTGNTSTGSESGVQSLLYHLKAPSPKVVVNAETHDKRIIFSENLSITGHLLGIIGHFFSIIGIFCEQCGIA